MTRAAKDRAIRPSLLEWLGEARDELGDIDASFVIAPLRESELERLAHWGRHRLFEHPPNASHKSHGQNRAGLGHINASLVGSPPTASELEEFARKGKNRLFDHSRKKRAPVLSSKAVTRYLHWAVAELERSLAEPPVGSREAKATEIVVRRFGLDATCTLVLGLARLFGLAGVCGQSRFGVPSLWHAMNQVLGDHIEASAVLLGVPRSAVERALRRLSEVGLSDPTAWGTNAADPDEYVGGWLDKVYQPAVATEEELRERLVPLAPPPLLDLDAFGHVDGGEAALRLLTAAIKTRNGVRFVFYGRAGTGKTEFSKSLAHAAGARLYDLSEPEPGGMCRAEGEAVNLQADRSADKRNRLRMALALLRSEPGAAILIDEVEDVLSSGEGSRRENHRLLEDAEVPVVFTGNDLSRFDEAMLRRFDLTIRFKAHSPTRRREVVRRMLESAEIPSLDGESLARLASRLADELECPPGIIERAIRSTVLVEGSPADLFHFAERHERTISTHIARPRLEAPAKAELPWKAFAHLGPEAEDVRRLLTAALGVRRDKAADSSAITFLAYGPPGCGKTEFCRTLAAETGATLYSVGGREIGPDARLPVPRSESLEYAIEALADEPNAVILFDEFEDFCVPSKHWLNSLVETTPVPLLFTANDIDALRWRPYFLDRLTGSLEFHHMPRGRRADIFRGLLGDSAEMAPFAEELAADRRATPRRARHAELVARLAGGGADTARRAVREKAYLLRGKRAVEPNATAKYDISLVHADPDLEVLTDEIGALGSERMGILLDGPSGSGKSEYAKQLARRMDLDPLPKRASELMSKWVGETEHQIAGAFAEARATNSFLIVDEADSFLADRRDAFRNWEISMVNEMLSQLESHDLPYAFTTNLADRLDPAVARRFLFRATFKFLDEARVVRAWEFFFDGECPAQVRSLTRLVPADFALVHERAEKLRFLDDPARLADDLATQCRDKSRPGAVGFGS
ncbi:MAG: AAA family ATPase [Acidobacteria bacterium]|nr:AAA family ATPase [Acidobacteriota bacterium]MYI38567.1 AAA family ATPase [Acidobacteriota bacterium]